MTRRIKRHQIREVMTRSPITVSPQTGVRELKSLFDEHDFNAFPVVDEHVFSRESSPRSTSSGWFDLRGVSTTRTLARSGRGTPRTSCDAVS